jgi:catechol 2,3-dioxygenase-like lactoylglutathione lyase family enzyme
MEVTALDHIVLVVADVARSCAFYERALGMRPVEHRPGQWALQFGPHKISLQAADRVPPIARRTTPGTGNFCVLTNEPMSRVVEHLERAGVRIVEGPEGRVGAAGPLLSVYFYDPDGNLVEVSNVIPDEAA